MSRRAGFTLLELLVTVGLMAAVAGGLIATLDGVEEQAQEQLAARELFEVRQALVRFRQDTGFLPREGPFALDSDRGAVKLTSHPDAADWFASPANLYQLLENPLQGPTTHVAYLAAPDVAHPLAGLASWDPERRRGWRGPYLPREGLTTIGRAGPGYEGPPLLGGVPAIADPFARPPQEATGAFAWITTAGTPFERLGRPVLVHTVAPGRARLVSAGPDGAFDTPDDLQAWVP